MPLTFPLLCDQNILQHLYYPLLERLFKLYSEHKKNSIAKLKLINSLHSRYKRLANEWIKLLRETELISEENGVIYITDFNTIEVLYKAKDEYKYKHYVYNFLENIGKKYSLYFKYFYKAFVSLAIENDFFLVKDFIEKVYEIFFRDLGLYPRISLEKGMDKDIKSFFHFLIFYNLVNIINTRNIKLNSKVKVLVRPKRYSKKYNLRKIIINHLRYKGVSYRVYTRDLCDEIAEKLGIEPETVFETLKEIQRSNSSIMHFYRGRLDLYVPPSHSLLEISNSEMIS